MAARPDEGSLSYEGLADFFGGADAEDSVGSLGKACRRGEVGGVVVMVLGDSKIARRLANSSRVSATGAFSGSGAFG